MNDHTPIVFLQIRHQAEEKTVSLVIADVLLNQGSCYVQRI